MSANELVGRVVRRGARWFLRRRYGNAWFLHRRYGPRWPHPRQPSDETQRKLFAAGIIATTVTATVILQRRALR